MALKQNRYQQGSNYFNYYREHINKLASEKPTNNNEISFSTYDLINFPFYVSDKFSELKKHPEYFKDLNKFKAGEQINSNGKSYDSILGNVRLFSASLNILLKKYKSLINEIEEHKILDKNQKNLLLKDLFDSQVEKYFNGCWLIDFDDELRTIKNDLHCAFVPNMTGKLLFFDKDFYELKTFIDKRKDLIKFTIA